jgi:hypothetical protein
VGNSRRSRRRCDRRLDRRRHDDRRSFHGCHDRGYNLRNLHGGGRHRRRDNRWRHRHVTARGFSRTDAIGERDDLAIRRQLEFL